MDDDVDTTEEEDNANNERRDRKRKIAQIEIKQEKEEDDDDEEREEDNEDDNEEEEDSEEDSEEGKKTIEEEEVDVLEQEEREKREAEAESTRNGLTITLQDRIFHMQAFQSRRTGGYQIYFLDENSPHSPEAKQESQLTLSSSDDSLSLPSKLHMYMFISHLGGIKQEGYFSFTAEGNPSQRRGSKPNNNNCKFHHTITIPNGAKTFSLKNFYFKYTLQSEGYSSKVFKMSTRTTVQQRTFCIWILFSKILLSPSQLNNDLSDIPSFAKFRSNNFLVYASPGKIKWLLSRADIKPKISNNNNNSNNNNSNNNNNNNANNANNKNNNNSNIKNTKSSSKPSTPSKSITPSKVIKIHSSSTPFSSQNNNNNTNTNSNSNNNNTSITKLSSSSSSFSSSSSPSSSKLTVSEYVADNAFDNGLSAAIYFLEAATAEVRKSLNTHRTSNSTQEKDEQLQQMQSQIDAKSREVDRLRDLLVIQDTTLRDSHRKKCEELNTTLEATKITNENLRRKIVSLEKDKVSLQEETQALKKIVADLKF